MTMDINFAASRNPFAKICRTADPMLAAQISEAAQKRARELVAEGPIPPEVLAKVAAIIGPIEVRPKPAETAEQ